MTLAGAGESLDLAPGELWSLVISGQGGLTLVNAGAAEFDRRSSRTTAEITLIYDAASSSALAPQKLTLDGATHVSLTEGSSPETQPTRLVVDSQGAKGNELNILDTPGGGPAEFSLKVIGGESLTLQESAASFGASRLDASKLSGALTVGIDFSDGATDLSLGSGNFVVKAQDSVALENLGDNATIQIDVDLNSVILGFARGASAAAAPIALALDLGAPGQSAPVSIGLIDADDVSALSIVSSGGANAVQTIIDPALTSLEVSGGGALEIDAIRGVKAVDGSKSRHRRQRARRFPDVGRRRDWRSGRWRATGVDRARAPEAARSPTWRPPRPSPSRWGQGRAFSISRMARPTLRSPG